MRMPGEVGNTHSHSLSLCPRCRSRKQGLLRVIGEGCTHAALSSRDLTGEPPWCCRAVTQQARRKLRTKPSVAQRCLPPWWSPRHCPCPDTGTASRGVRLNPGWGRSAAAVDEMGAAGAAGPSGGRGGAAGTWGAFYIYPRASWI